MKTSNNFPIIFIGDIDTGITTLMNALKGEYYDNDFYKKAREKDKYNGKEFEDNIFNYTSLRDDSKEKLESLKKAICILIISCQEDDLVKSTNDWLIKTNEIKNENIVKFLVYTKTDFAKPEINKSQIRLKYNIKAIIETSCKQGIGIQELRDEVNQEFKKFENDREKSQVIKIVECMSKTLCELVARDHSVLYSIEWRDLERIIATALDSLGFSVFLTPASKDGGKDIIASCIVKNKEIVYYIEIKHWIKKGKVSPVDINSFVEVNLKNKTSGGLFLSTSGYTQEVYKSLSSITKQKVRIGDENKIVTLCKKYAMCQSGVWYPQSALPELLFEDSI